ncbi:UV-stimulated scaffold protein A homolog [Lactuca sativa]|uniref:UV-stimulated scaffold protein A C-terminal domain-containing protein n=1 Tax=Lactuca sativa TaxID=4236 RepID=A0A9R1X1V1_LACSA|nr:UV-stimulated scaffold protein A homolog [Lactuca sativa]KAJ0195079.1 hypothetical protein LSAT_V11C700342850 [Lactuca sativa]
MEWEVDEGKVAAAVVVGLIEKATNSTEPDLDPRILKSIKSVVRHSDLELRLAVENLMSLMKRDHSQVRYLALAIIHELFMRSKLFRRLIVENLEQLLSLSVGFRRNQPLPAPPAIASKLRLKAIEFLERWNTTFGIHYRQLRLGYDYLKNTLRFQFPNLQANAARAQQERRERELRTKEILLKKYELLKSNLPSIKEEVKSMVDEINECLDILQSCKEPNLPLSPIDEEEEEYFEEFRNLELRQIRDNSLKEADKVQENSENKVVFDALRELYKLLVTKHIVAVQESISVLIRVELSDNRVRDSMLKEFIDTRNHLKTIKKKCEEAGCGLSVTTDEGGGGGEEDIWEEGTSERFDIPKPNKQSEEDHDANKSKDDAIKIINSKVVCDADLDPLKSKLMGEAPVMKWGSFLDNWGSVMANQRGLEVEGHWGRVDYDAVIPANKVAELNMQATVYEEDDKEIQQCGAPLKKEKGGLCTRRDLKICPFHGRIVPRDNQGKPLINDNYLSETEPKENLLSVSTEELAKQAVIIKKREFYDNKKEMKRAKLAKVRGHNDAVLRDAALASTSATCSIGEDVKTREKNNSLAKMLKKKVSVKDRLGTRLLNRKATARATQMMMMNLGDDRHSKYREAFPNQW